MINVELMIALRKHRSTLIFLSGIVIGGFSIWLDLYKIVVAFTVFFIGTAIFFKYGSWFEKNKNRISVLASLITIVSFPALIVGGVLGYYQLIDLIQKPELELQFVGTNKTSFAIYNNSNVVAENPKYGFAIIEIGNKNTIPIPTKTGDFVSPNAMWGPFSFSEFTGKLEEGKRFFGYAATNCLECARTNSYWIYIETGKGGNSWYAKERDGEVVGVSMDYLIFQNEVEEKIRSIGESRRIPILMN